MAALGASWSSMVVSQHVVGYNVLLPRAQKSDNDIVGLGLITRPTAAEAQQYLGQLETQFSLCSILWELCRI
jgi:hypothetical protein